MVRSRASSRGPPSYPYPKHRQRQHAQSMSLPWLTVSAVDQRLASSPVRPSPRQLQSTSRRSLRSRMLRVYRWTLTQRWAWRLIAHEFRLLWTCRLPPRRLPPRRRSCPRQLRGSRPYSPHVVADFTTSGSCLTTESSMVCSTKTSSRSSDFSRMCALRDLLQALAPTVVARC